MALKARICRTLKWSHFPETGGEFKGLESYLWRSSLVQLDSLSRPIFQKLVDVERELSRARGPFWLFAIGMREEAVDRWDLIVSASWLLEDKVRSLACLSSRLQRALAPNELIQISRIATLGPENPVVQNLTAAFSQRSALNAVQNTIVNGMEFSEVVVITAQRPDTEAAMA